MDNNISRKEFESLQELVYKLVDTITELTRVHELGQEKTIQKFQEHDELFRIALSNFQSLYDIIEKGCKHEFCGPSKTPAPTTHNFGVYFPASRLALGPE